MRRASLLPLLLAVLLAGPALADGVPVDLELVLAVDVSHSIDETDGKLQREGYAQAFRDQRIVDAIRSGRNGSIAVTYLEWSAAEYQRVVVGWSLIDGKEAADGFAARLSAQPRVSQSWTAIGAAIDAGVILIGANAYEGTRKVIDVSGDGVNNHGRAPAAARDEAIADGVTINGLAIMRPKPAWTWPPEPPLDEYYRENVVGGTNSFLIVATEAQAFPRAILQKLLREIADAGGPPAEYVSVEQAWGEAVSRPQLAERDTR
ncbi:uncharacterized protein DUF1194 [Stella humosa]|uniref:Uncharacterized protein DUF1194 n=1 Tax=Stella humosa TaxID=94 RepID=A0A3N1M0Q5_9PROT|nr:DUF1194 domain-containing protein [Stella humosa]ROQ01074.1 uncharacterized protein DUF1194 [Stella humosa]BBK31446.1 hypothetical protein STHU_20800 [Stella humosa]